MQKIMIILTVFGLVFFGLYQKQKVLILAYKLNAKKVSLEKLEEEKADLLCLFLHETNLAVVNQRFKADGISPQYPREYVKLVPALNNEIQARPTILAKVLRVSNRAEASQ